MKYENKKQYNKKAMAAVMTLALLSPLVSNMAVIAHAGGTSIPSTQMKDAMTMVSVAERVNFPQYTEYAQKTVQVLPNSSVKTDLLNRLAILQSRTALTQLDNRFYMMQRDNLYQDISYGESLVKSVKSVPEQKIAQEKWNQTQDRLNLMRLDTRIYVLGKYQQREDLVSAQSLVGKIQNSVLKQEAMKRLDQASNRYYASYTDNLLNRASYLSSKEHLIKAKEYVALMKDANLKQMFIGRIKETEERINSSYIRAKYDVARSTELLLDARSSEEALLKNPTPYDKDIKTEITNHRLNMERATVYQLLRMVNPTNERDIDDTKSYIYTATKDTALRTDAFNKLDDMKQTLLERKADFATSTAVSTRLKTDVDFAKSVVAQLKNTSIKNGLLGKLNGITSVNKDASEVAPMKVAEAERTNQFFTKELAQYTLNKVPYNHSSKALLQQRMNRVMDGAYIKPNQ